MSRITDLISQSSKTLFSIEILPPLKGESIQSVFKGIDPLMEFKPPFIDVTYHREEYKFTELANGLIEKKISRKRPGTVAICAAVMNRYQVDAVPHIICGGFTKEETENALIDLHFLGIENVLALRGDAIKSEGVFYPEPDGNKNSIELIEQISELNSGKYLDPDLKNGYATKFCIGVAAYPEKHFEAPNMLADIKFLKKKVEMGADYIVTQMFFDNTAFFKFVDSCRSEGITIPIIPGLKPITNSKQLAALPRIFNIDIPFELSEALMAAKNEESVRQIGIEWCIQQSKELVAYGVPCLHYYTMGKSEAVKKVAESLF